jgi:DNA-binding transcriptional regulator YiaG
MIQPAVDIAPAAPCGVSVVTLTDVEKLLIIRHRRGLTVARAAKRWRLNARTLHAWEQGIGGAKTGSSRFPSPEAAERIKVIVRDEERKGF